MMEDIQLPVPLANSRAHRIVIHSDVRIDNYRWLQNKEAQEVEEYIRAENSYTDSVMRSTETLQNCLYKEILNRVRQSDESSPVHRGSYYYYDRTEEGKQYCIYCRRKSEPEAEEEVILDLNLLAEGKSFLELGAFLVSDDNLLAYSIDTIGSRTYTLFIKDLSTGKLLPDCINGVTSIAWAADNCTLFYIAEDELKRPSRLYRHQLAQETDELIYEEVDDSFVLWVERTRSKEFVLLVSGSHTTSEVWYVPADAPTQDWRIIAPREHQFQYYVDHGGDRFYIRANDMGDNFRVVSVPVSAPDQCNWEEIVPHSDNRMIEGFEVFEHFYALWEREAGLPHLQVFELDRDSSHRIELPEPIYDIYQDVNPEFSQRAYRFRYESLTTPVSVFEYDVARRQLNLLKQTEVLGGYESTLYQSERLFVEAADGVQIPVSLLYRKEMRRDGKAPMLLVGYGSYGLSCWVGFSHSRVSLLDRGVTFAMAHVRGGGEMGKQWHDTGRMQWKKNTFTDFISVAEFLVDSSFTSRDRLVIEGGSAGGLLVAVVTNMRSDLFKSVVMDAPFLAVLDTMLDSTLPFTTLEYEEWGNPSDPEQYRWMREYCPYSNLAAQNYPAMLVKASFNDNLAPYWGAAKYVARLRHLKTDDNLLLLQVKMTAGHEGVSGRYDRIRERAFDLAFMLTQLGIRK